MTRTFSATSQCKTIESIGHTNEPFPQIIGLDSLQNTDKQYAVDLHFSTDNSAGAQILLTTDKTKTNASLDDVYILTFESNVQLRLENGDNNIVQPIKGLLSSIEIQSFWLHISTSM